MTPLGRADSYVFLELISESLMSQVFLAWDERTVDSAEAAPPVIVKRIHPNIVSQGTYRKLFQNEVRITSGIQHPNIVRILNSGTDQGATYLVLEYIHGKSVKEILEFEFARNHRGIPYAYAQTLLHEIAKTVGYLHDHPLTGPRGASQIIHRDLTPQNLMINENGEVKLIDFGIAKSVSGHTTTHSDLVHGRSGYISPEQIAGENPDQRSDVFTLGCLFFEILTGKRLFLGANELATIDKVKQSDRIAGAIPQLLREAVPEIPKHVGAAISQCVRQNPRERFTSPFQLLAALFPDGSQKIHATDMEFFSRELSIYVTKFFGDELAQHRQKITDKIESMRLNSPARAPIAEADLPELDFPEASAPPEKKPPIFEKPRVPQAASPVVELQRIAPRPTPKIAEKKTEKRPQSRKGLALFSAVILGGIGIWMTSFHALPRSDARQLEFPIRIYPQPTVATLFVDGVPQIIADPRSPKLTLPVPTQKQLKIAIPGFHALDAAISITSDNAESIRESGFTFILTPLASAGKINLESWLPWVVDISGEKLHWVLRDRKTQLALPPGTYRIHTSLWGWKLPEFEVQIHADEETHLKLRGLSWTIETHGQKSR